jgi:S-phase kinase-associated protein 1
MMMISVKTGDNADFQIPMELAMASKTIANMLEDMAPGVLTGDELPDEVVPLPNVTARDMELIVAYWTQRAPDRSVGDFAATLTNAEVWALLEATDYLNITPLFTGLTAYAAIMLKDKTPEEMREVLGVTNDFTPEEEAQIKKECGWALR